MRWQGVMTRNNMLYDNSSQTQHRSFSSSLKSGRQNASTPKTCGERGWTESKTPRKSTTPEQTLTHFWAVFPGQFHPFSPLLLFPKLQARKSPP